MGRQGPKRILEMARSGHLEARIALSPALERRIQREKRSNQPLPLVSIDDMMESMEFHPSVVTFSSMVLSVLMKTTTFRGLA